MKNLKSLGFCGILLVLFFIPACKEDEADLNPNLRTAIAICDVLATDNETKVRIYSMNLDQGSVNIHGSVAEAGDGVEFTMDGNGVDFNFSVNEWGVGTPKQTTVKSYAGKLYESAFVKDQVNKLEIVRDGDDWKLLLNGSDQIIPGSMKGGYICTNGTCLSVTSGNDYTTLSECQTACGGGANLNLDGNWSTASGNSVTISGPTGTFYAFNSTWQTYQAKGVVNIGDAGFKNITKVSTYKWNCLTLSVRLDNQVPVEAIWSDDGILTMSNDGKSFTVVSNVTTNGTTKLTTSVFYRQ